MFDFPFEGAHRVVDSVAELRHEINTLLEG